MRSKPFRLVTFVGALTVLLPGAVVQAQNTEIQTDESTTVAAVQAQNPEARPDTPTPLAVTLKSVTVGKKKVWQGSSNVTVKTRGTAPVKAQFAYLIASTGTVVPVTTTPSTPSTAPTALIVTASAAQPIPLTPGQDSAPVTLTFMAPEGVDASALTGTLLTRSDQTTGFGTALPVTFTLPVTANPRAFAPAKVTMNLTKIWPGWIAEWPKHRLNWTGSAQASEQSEWLSSDTGGRLKVTSTPVKAGTGERSFTLRPSEVMSAGTYSGDLTLTPDAPDEPKLAVTVNVQHLFVWPLLAILVGCWCAYKLIRRRELLRPKELLRHQLKLAENTYNADRTALAAETGTTDFPYTYFRVKDFTTPMFHSVDKARTREELDASAKEIDGFTACVKAWSSVQREVIDLRKRRNAIQQAITSFGIGNELTTYPALSEAGRLLKFDPNTFQIPTTSEELTRIQGDIATTRSLLTALENGIVLYRQAQDTYQALVEAGRQEELKDINPLSTFQEAFRHADTLPKLEEGIEQLAGLETKLDNMIRQGFMSLNPMSLQPGGNPLGLNPTAVPETRTAEKIALDIQVLDRTDYIVAFVVAVATHFVTIYSKGTFGAWHEYLTAFLFGLGGTLLAKGASLTGTLPWQRSMRYAADEAA